MAAPSSLQKRLLEQIKAKGVSPHLEELNPKPPEQHPLPPRLPRPRDYQREAVTSRRQTLTEAGFQLESLYLEPPGFDPASLQGNIESFIGFAQVPVGVIGPLRVNGLYAQGDFYVPLATSEGALVASFNRGAAAISQAGGASLACLTESVSRAPVFVFESLAESCRFSVWVLEQLPAMQELVSQQSRFCRLQEIRTKIIGKEVYIIFEYSVGDASGQNMVTIATDKICRGITADCPIRARSWYIDGNLSGDKKASMLSYGYVRGKKVVAEVSIKRDLVKKLLHVEPEEMFRYWQVSFLGGTLSGAIGSQGHFANGLAALFIACGQDAACVSEAAVGITRIDVLPDGSLYVALTLPNLIVGTVGGGTALPTARQCLALLGCEGAGKAQKFAEICAATILAGEISMIAALTHGDFASAHEKLGRKST